MTVPATAWVATLVVVAGLLVFDYVFHVRTARTPTLRESAIWSAAYVGVAVLFGVVVWWLGGSAMGTEYFAGYITEKALSVDNLFVFLIILTSFRVPSADQQKVILFGVAFSIVARTGFIFLGATLINRFAWVFYLFGIALLMTAGNMLRPEGEDSHTADNIMVRIARRLFKTSAAYDEDRLITIIDGRRVMTPMLLVMVSIAGTDLLFAVDSIPAIFGLTQNVFIVFTATTFSLLGLRQLFFLIEGLLDRLIYLSYGLAAILAFIGAKLVLHALHENNVGFINDGEPVPVVEVSTGMSLVVIVAVLTLTVLVSLLSTAGKAQTAITSVRRRASRYLDLGYEEDLRLREEAYAALCQEEQVIRSLPEKYRARIREGETELIELIDRAHEIHADRVARREAGLPYRM